MVQVRRAHENDIREIVAVVNAAFEVERDLRGGERTSVAEVCGLMEKSAFLVAIHDEQIAGAVLVRVNETVGYFGMLAVLPGLQRSGIGRALLDAAEDYCRKLGCTEMTLSTGRVRHELLDRYARYGYKITSIESTAEAAGFVQPIEIVKMAKRL